MDIQNKIPVTVITGFLGAGKTTFINQLLKNNPETKFALIENEFGDVAVDSKLIKGVDASQMFELKNGCICCTISNEFELALAELAEKFPDVEHLLIETTGIADPGPVIRPFFADENLKTYYRYNGTVCLADVRNFQKYPAKNVAIKQLAIADAIIITKAEDFTKKQKEEFLSEIRQLNPLATFVVSIFGKVDEFDLFQIQVQKVRYVADRTETHENLQVKSIRFEKVLWKHEFAERLAYNLDLYKNEIYRVKGILCFENEPYQYILQGVGGSFEITESDELKNSPVSEIVLIGNLEKVDLAFITQE